MDLEEFSAKVNELLKENKSDELFALCDSWLEEIRNNHTDTNTNLASIYNARGLAFGKNNDYQKAIDCYNMAIELNPDYASAYNNRGKARNALRQHEEAIEDFSKAIG